MLTTINKVKRSDAQLLNEAAENFSKKILDTDISSLYKEIMSCWDNNDMKDPDAALSDLCQKICPSHKEIKDVIIKIGAINQIYATRVRTIDTYTLANHIVECNENGDLKENIDSGNKEVVRWIANSKGKEMANHYSFATKYCSFHNPEKYAIYDSYLAALVRAFSKLDGNRFKKLTSIDKFEQYEKYCERIDAIKKFCSEKLRNGFNYKSLDRFLWLGVKKEFEDLKGK